MDRRAVLAALAEHGQLTPELQLVVRAGGQAAVYDMLCEADAHPAVFLAAGLVRPGSTAQDSVEDAVMLHLALMGMDALVLRWLDSRIADRARLDPAWERQVVAEPPLWAHALPQRVGRLLLQTGPAWAPLHGLIAAGIWPYGPAADGQTFLMAQAPDESHGT